MDLSYAQNLEDWRLAQAFAGQETGFYIDIGAGHPVADNVSFWFYTQNWRGIVVEPQRDLLARYCPIRPRDTALDLLIGLREGEADFHIVERLHGFSTTVEPHARAAAAFGAGFRTERRRITTLARLCETHVAGPIDFLKIDVEGAEADVLAGGDWRRFRPRILVIEAVRPGSMAPAWPDWEPRLVAQGYRFVLFDRLNRFYVAEEEADLAARLPAGEIAWDVVPHLYQYGAAPDRPDHPDHVLARRLVEGLLAEAPALSRGLIWRLLTRSLGPAELAAAPEEAAVVEAAQALLGRLGAPQPPAASSLGAWYRGLIGSDGFRAALGRIAATFDGGHMEEG